MHRGLWEKPPLVWNRNTSRIEIHRMRNWKSELSNERPWKKIASSHFSLHFSITVLESKSFLKESFFLGLLLARLCELDRYCLE